MGLEFLNLLELCRQGNINVRSDSRRVGRGDIFVALRGSSQDGSDFIAQAMDAGAAYVVCAPEVAKQFASNSQCRLVCHPDPHEALISLAAARWNTEDSPLRVIGITGTNGKTTTAYLLEHLFNAAGFSTGVIGTISYRWPGFSQAAPLTTPGPLELHEMLSGMARAGVEIAIMEVSSHALDQDRAGGISFDGAIFTNLTQDHLDYHKDMESYFRAKARLFMNAPKPQKAMAINGDDRYGRRLLEQLPQAMAFGLHNGLPGEKRLTGNLVSSTPTGLELSMRFGDRRWDLHSHLVGEFNAYNLMGAQALALEMGLDTGQLKSLEEFRGVPGRLERIANNQCLNVFVDYAHTPDALAKALNALRGSGFKRLITVFGCGGNRDKGKRPLMGKAVAEYSDIAVLTSDNPRFEDPLAIMEDAKAGLRNAAKVVFEPDRRKATALALDMMDKDSALLIAGKGHEDYQIINGVKHHYSDQEVVRELLA